MQKMTHVLGERKSIKEGWRGSRRWERKFSELIVWMDVLLLKGKCEKPLTGKWKYKM